MTEQVKQQILDAKTTEEKIKAVNKILLDGEPKNISIDNYSGFTGYKPQYIVDAMNAVFKIGQWGFEEVASEIVTHQTEKGTSSLAIAQVKVWIKDIEFKPVGYGQSRVTKGDTGDAKKGAQTDAIKKALSYFSIGNRAYHGLLKAA
jgi:recombination DNA repair RAD52 pathway protein